MVKLHEMSNFDIKHSRKGLDEICLSLVVYNKNDIEDIQNGDKGLKCKFCHSIMTPLISNNGNLNCSECESLLYDGVKNIIK